jgi:hypothetical protein
MLAARADQEAHLRFGLHALGDDVQIELVREPEMAARTTAAFR